MHNLIPLTSLCGVIIPYLSVYPKLSNSLDIMIAGNEIYT